MSIQLSYRIPEEIHAAAMKIMELENRGTLTATLNALLLEAIQARGIKPVKTKK